jgi:hypothetical protein
LTGHVHEIATVWAALRSAAGLLFWNFDSWWWAVPQPPVHYSVVTVRLSDICKNIWFSEMHATFWLENLYGRGNVGRPGKRREDKNGSWVGRCGLDSSGSV